MTALPPGPPSRYNTGSGAGLVARLLIIATYSRILWLSVLLRFSGTVRKPHFTCKSAGGSNLQAAFSKVGDFPCAKAGRKDSLDRITGRQKPIATSVLI